MVDVTAPDRLDGIAVRRATAADARPTYAVVVEATGHLARLHGWEPIPRPPEPGERFLGFRTSALRHDPDGFWVGEVDGELVGFGIAVQREHVWYLAALHVLPAYQSRGLGAELIRRALAAARPGSLLTVGTDARNPVSNALYGRFGMFPQEPLLEVAGPTAAATDATIGRADLASQLVPGLPSADILATIDRGALEVARPEDHEFWASVPGLHGYTLAHDGRPLGYAYVQADGVIGPIAVLDPMDLADAVEGSIRCAAELGATTARMRIPGVARAAVAGLLARGWRYGDGVTLALSSAPWGHWDRYVSSGGDALL